MSSYRIVVRDNYHYMNPDEVYEIEGFETAEQAVIKCKQIVDEDLQSYANPGRSAETIYQYYVMFGDNPSVVGPISDIIEFSAWEYAKLRSAEFVVPLIDENVITSSSAATKRDVVIPD